MLPPCTFRKLCQQFYTPGIVFATRIDALLPAYVSLQPDPSDLDIYASSLDWGVTSLCAFPPFSVFSRTLLNLRDVGASVLMILPLWPTPVWFPVALQLLVATPTLTHPSAHKVVLAAMLLS